MVVIKNILGLLKSNLIYILMACFVSAVAYYANQVSEVTSLLIKAKTENKTLNKSLSNVTADKEILALSLKSEVLFRQDLERTIKLNDERHRRYIESLELAVGSEKNKVDQLKKTIKELPNENCINADMPSSIIGMFYNKTN